MEEGFCKSCRNIDVTDEFVKDMLATALKNGKAFVSDEQYEERLSECDRCPSLQYSSTCMHSGSLVSYRARLSQQTCPHPDGNKWGIV